MGDEILGFSGEVVSEFLSLVGELCPINLEVAVVWVLEILRHLDELVFDVVLCFGEGCLEVCNFVHPSLGDEILLRQSC